MHPIKYEGLTRVLWKNAVACSTSGTRRVTDKHEHHTIWKLCWTPIYGNKYSDQFSFENKTFHVKKKMMYCINCYIQHLDLVQNRISFSIKLGCNFLLNHKGFCIPYTYICPPFSFSVFWPMNTSKILFKIVFIETWQSTKWILNFCRYPVACQSI